MNIAIVLSGGIGSRLKSQVPKQYVNVCGEMIITYTLHALCNNGKIDAIHVVADHAWWEPILMELSDTKKVRGFSLPGENRQLSILNGLNAVRDYVRDDDTVLIHDAVRPCITDKLISDTIDGVGGHDGVVPVLPLKDTVYSSEDGRVITGLLERDKILAGQAPESFIYGKYLSANESLSHEEMMNISGSTQPAVMAGMKIRSIPGDEDNFKITTNQDLDRFTQIIESRRVN